MVKSRRPATDDDGLIELKHAWTEYGRNVFTGIVIAAVALISWFGRDYYEERHLREAFDLFIEVSTAMDEEDAEQVEAFFADLEAAYSDTAYVTLSAMSRARFYALRDDLSKAAESLEVAVDYATRQEIEFLRGIAIVRLARVLVAQGENDRALDVLATELPPGIAALADEVRGDVLAAMDQKQEAANAYRDASRLDDVTGFLYMKSQQLGVKPTAENKASDSETK